MNTRLRTADDTAIAEAVALLRAGRLVAFPTETVYGLGGRADSAEAVDAIFAAKARPADNPLIVHVATLADAAPFARIDARAEALAAAFWPGPLTLVLPRTAPMPAARDLDTVAIRAPQHPVALALLRAAGPLAAPSANRSGRPSPTRATHVMADLEGLIPLVLDGGPCTVGIESTVLALFDDRPRILRPGEITAAQLARVLGDVATEAGSTRSPGTRYAHYRPRSPVVLVEAGIDARALCERLPGAALIDRGPDLAAHLYADLRAADGAPWIVVQGVTADAAVMERARRAAAHVLSDAFAVERFVAEIAELHAPPTSVRPTASFSLVRVIQTVRLTVAVAALVAAVIYSGVWVAIVAAAAGVGALWLVRSIRQRRAEKAWEDEVTQVARTEKLVDLGHTQGGLSDPSEGEAGGLSDAEAGHLSPPERR